MMRFDRLLHETIDEMAAELKGPSAAMVSGAVARGRRIRRGRRLAAAGGALAATAAIALPWAILARPERPAPPATTTDGGGLPGGWVVTGTPRVVLDRSSGVYVPQPQAGTVLPAPVGDRVLITGDPGSLTLAGVRDTTPVTVDGTGLGGDYQWAPGGDRLVARASQKEPFQIGFAVIDARTGAVSRHWIDRSRYDCSRCTFSWTRDGREVVMAIADRSGGEAEERIAGLQLFDATSGAPTRSLPLKVMPSGPFSWSPGGRYVVATADPLRGQGQLIDVATGTGRPFPSGAVWVSDDRLLVASGGTVQTLRPDGTVVATTRIDLPGAAESISLGPPR